MKKTLTFAIIVLMASVIYLSSGCDKNKDPEVVEFMMAVDSISHPDTIPLGEVLEIRFYGVIGPNDCFEFSRFEPGFGDNLMEFTLYAKEIKRDDCKGAGQYLNGGGVGITDATAGEWEITVNQPEGIAPITSTVFVEE